MLTHPTTDRLRELGLAGMARALEEQRRHADAATTAVCRNAMRTHQAPIQRQGDRVVLIANTGAAVTRPQEGIAKDDVAGSISGDRHRPRRLSVFHACEDLDSTEKRVLSGVPSSNKPLPSAMNTPLNCSMTGLVGIAPVGAMSGTYLRGQGAKLPVGAHHPARTESLGLKGLCDRYCQKSTVTLVTK